MNGISFNFGLCGKLAATSVMILCSIKSAKRQADRKSVV